VVKLVSELRQIGGFLQVLLFPPAIILLKVALNTLKPTIQPTKNYAVNWDWNLQKTDEINTNSHYLFYKILNGFNGLTPACLCELVQPYLPRKSR